MLMPAVVSKSCCQWLFPNCICVSVRFAHNPNYFHLFIPGGAPRETVTVTVAVAGRFPIHSTTYSVPVRFASQANHNHNHNPNHNSNSIRRFPGVGVCPSWRPQKQSQTALPWRWRQPKLANTNPIRRVPGGRVSPSWRGFSERCVCALLAPFFLSPDP